MPTRLQRLVEQMGTADVDAVAVVPGPNMTFLTGLDFHMSERPVIVVLSLGAQPAIVVPALEAVKVADGLEGMEWLSFPYTDEEGPLQATARLCDILNLSRKRLAVEELTMRVLVVPSSTY